MKCETMEELMCWARECGIKPEDLDELVHEFKAAEAAEINNGGLEAQLEYLVQCCGSVRDLQEALERELGI
ncbi:hypothetical protein SAMN00808754_1683 [Thermanaeromonas toyohensis ToBE]|uniref:Uncharacterized protein n=1 Tax=Thermanaeromonas toyohensis ToBE TaxID=698762 RepID=A0A1W1VVF5_9FIRM|nr:hypothetical protein [Thermanaeromonas toyohensis]SMB96844.1 hypothetical protein SAMN00808754_1683 [Thermanaeromonas toyohensis ToBE]